MNLIDVITAIGMFQAVQLGIVGLWVKRGQTNTNLIFAAAMFTLAALLTLGGRTPAKPPYELTHLWGALALSFSPLVFLHVRTAVDQSPLKRRDLLHFLPALIHFCLLIPIWIRPQFRQQTIQIWLDMELYRSFVPGLRIGALQALIYLPLSFWWVRRFEKHQREAASFTDPLYTAWLKLFTSQLLVLLLVLGFGRIIHGAPLDELGRVAFGLVLMVTSTITLIRPQLFHGVPQALQLPEEPKAPAKYGTSSLDPIDASQIAAKLKAWFETERPFLEPNLTLADVQQALGIQRAHLSRVINQDLNSHFQDFVNDYRIDEAKTLMTDARYNFLSIDGIALEVGFKSRSVFYNAFRKRVGSTPAAWRKAQTSD